MIRSEALERFLLGFGLDLSDNGLGRPTTISPLWTAVREKCGDCDMDEVLDALYNLDSNCVELYKFVAVGAGFQRVSFESQRSTPEWKDFFTRGDFRVKVLPPGRIRFQKLDDLMAGLWGSAQVRVEDPDRQFARMAIDEARKSIPENDGKPHPWVGAVVVKDGKVLSVAHRGEVPGNHAEFVALERNLSDTAVAGATVYTTLEPCTTRNRPKIPCADRLIERRVGRVIIGILDPDDRIRGKGQRKLSNAGIATSLFPHDLAMEIEELNREFTRACEQQSQAQRFSPSKNWEQLEAGSPRIYVDIADERMDGRKVAFVISNHGGDVAHKTQVEPLRLPAGMAEFPLIELIPAHSQKRILPEVEKANIFERHDIARLLMKEWDAAGKLTEEFSWTMKVTYEDFAKNKFETLFDLVFLPIQDILKQKHGESWPKHDRETLEVRNLVIRKVPTK